MIHNEGKKDEVAVRVVMESEEFGREYYDYDSLDRCVGSLIRLVQSAIPAAGKDSVQRIVGIAIIPKSCYGQEDGYYDGCPDLFEIGVNVEPTQEGSAAMDVLANLP